MDVSIVYVTTNNIHEAKEIGQILVEERFAASVNIFNDIQSIYRWNNKIYDKAEALLIAKTSSTRVDDVIERIRSLHSYQCPCIISWSLGAGNSDYFSWKENQTI